MHLSVSVVMAIGSHVDTLQFRHCWNYQRPLAGVNSSCQLSGYTCVFVSVFSCLCKWSVFLLLYVKIKQQASERQREREKKLTVTFVVKLLPSAWSCILLVPLPLASRDHRNTNDGSLPTAFRLHSMLQQQPPQVPLPTINQWVVIIATQWYRTGAAIW